MDHNLKKEEFEDRKEGYEWYKKNLDGFSYRRGIMDTIGSGLIIACILFLLKFIWVGFTTLALI